MYGNNDSHERGNDVTWIIDLMRALVGAKDKLEGRSKDRAQELAMELWGQAQGTPEEEPAQALLDTIWPNDPPEA